MLGYIARRLAWAVVVTGVVVTVAFALVYVVPGDPARAVAGAQASPQAVANVRHQLGLDDSLPAQYIRYIGRLAQGNLGFSFDQHASVWSLIRPRLPATLLLATAGIIISLLIGITLGATAALREGAWPDRAVLVFASVSVSVPQFWLGLMLLYVLAAQWQLLPIGGYGGVAHLLLPALTLGLTGASWYARVFRTSMGETLGADYIRAARAKGLPPRTILLRHVAPNAVTPVLTLIGLDFAVYLGGVVVIEAVFDWPGIGTLAWQAIGTQDLPVILGTVLVAAIAVILVNLLIDIAYAIVDRRVRYV